MNGDLKVPFFIWPYKMDKSQNSRIPPAQFHAAAEIQRKEIIFFKD